jgi:hypothetical protein
MRAPFYLRNPNAPTGIPSRPRGPETDAVTPEAEITASKWSVTATISPVLGSSSTGKGLPIPWIQVSASLFF